MYIKKILLAIAILGLIGLSVFSYYIYTSIFSGNTSFTGEKKIVYVPTGADYQTVIDSLQPYVEDMESFDLVARKKGYASNIRAGRYAIKPGMNNNELVNALRSGNLPVKITFNNQERLENLAGRVAQQIEADSAALIKAFKDKEFLAENDFTEAGIRSLLDR